MKKTILRIGGMSCSACSSGLEKYLKRQKGIESASVNLVLAQALIEYEDALSIEKIEKYIEEAGYKSLGIYDPKQENQKASKDVKWLVLFAFLSLIILYISMTHMIGLSKISLFGMMQEPLVYALVLLLLTIPFLVYGFDIFQSGVKNLVHKNPNMDTLVSIGVISSFLYSLFNTFMIIKGNTMYVHYLYFESAAIIIFFIKLGRYIDGKSKERTKDAIKELVQITPSFALLKKKEEIKRITIDEVKKGDILIAKPGMKIAVDGVIVKGETHLDESFITGESIPIKKGIHEKVVAGSMNHEGYIEYEAQKIGKDSTISEIVRLVIEATNTKAPIARIADRVSNYFVPGIIVLALITFLGYLIFGFEINEAITSFVTVLVVACPCALGLATPLAIVVSEGLSAKQGILIKNSETLENAHKVDTIVFDKTGTLTYGNLKISKVFNYSDTSDLKLIQKVAIIESKSSHPIASTFQDYIKENKSEVKDFENIPGIGLGGKIDGKQIYVGNSKLFLKLHLKNNYIHDEEVLLRSGCSIVYVIEEEKVIGLIGVTDIVRKEAKMAISQLTKMNKQVIMLTGDNEKTAQLIAQSVSIQNVISSVMPKDKADILKGFIKDGKRVMMVGDGINDAPSLATANIGVSVNSGTDIAADSADVILMNDDLEKIPLLITISKKTIQIVKENLFWAFFYNLCMIPIAIGLLKPLSISMNPMIASFAMMLSSFTVILNSLRLKNMNLKKER